MAAGRADFCITSVQHYLAARSEERDLAARFVAVFGQQQTIGALVPDDSDIVRLDDLVGRRLGGQADNFLVRGFQEGMAHLGLGPAELVTTPDPPAAALPSGTIDFVAATVDTVRRNERHAGMGLRPLALGLDRYMSGLVAGDHVPDDVAAQMRNALVESFERQRSTPDGGVAELRRRYPDVDADDARVGWLAVEPFIFCGRPAGSMDPDRWRVSVSYAASVLQVPAPDPSSFYRSEFCS